MHSLRSTVHTCTHCILILIILYLLLVSCLKGIQIFIHSLDQSVDTNTEIHTSVVNYSAESADQTKCGLREFQKS